MDLGVQTLKSDDWLVIICLCDLEPIPHLLNENVGDLGFLSVLILCDSF